MEVRSVGAYNVSVAYSLKDLTLIDEDVFKISKHYSEIYGFLIFVFNPKKLIKGHPIAYVHDLLPGDRLFVPCRHEHGSSHKKPIFDHLIFTLNVGTGYQAGVKYDHDIIIVKNILNVSPLRRHIPDEFIIRALEIHGPHVNEDIIFQLANKEELEEELAKQDSISSSSD